jgi:type VI secretion system protein ImpK
VAGELFFHKLERLLHLRDPAYVELATVYLMALALGFRGKFRGVDDGGQLDHYRQQLFVFIAHRHPRLVDEAQHLLPAAYAYTLDGERGQRLPEPRLWIILVVVLLLVFGGISYGVWSHVTTDLHGVLQRILTRR